MKRHLTLYFSCMMITATVFAQVPEPGTFQYLQNQYSKRNSDVTEYLIKECNLYLQMNWNSANMDQVLFILANLYEEEKMNTQAFLAYLKIKFIVPNSNRRNDALSNLNQIIHNKAERVFEEKIKVIDALLSQSFAFQDRNEGMYEYLKFLHEINIEEINELLVDQINFYLLLYPDKVKNPDQLYFWAGDIHKKLSDEYEAILAFEKIPFIAPQSILIPQALFQVGLLQYKEISEYVRASETFAKLISDYADIAIAGEAQFYLAELYENKLDKPEEAVRNYRLLVESYPKNIFAVESLKRVAEMMAKQNRYEEAIAGYYQIVELYPKNEFAPKSLMEIESIYRRQLENYEKAIEVLKTYAAQYPDQEDAAENLYNAAELYVDELKDKKAAIDTYHEVINKFPASKYAERAKDKIEDLSKE